MRRSGLSPALIPTIRVAYLRRGAGLTSHNHHRLAQCVLGRPPATVYLPSTLPGSNQTPPPTCRPEQYPRPTRAHEPRSIMAPAAAARLQGAAVLVLLGCCLLAPSAATVVTTVNKPPPGQCARLMVAFV